MKHLWMGALLAALVCALSTTMLGDASAFPMAPAHLDSTSGIQPVWWHHWHHWHYWHWHRWHRW